MSVILTVSDTQADAADDDLEGLQATDDKEVGENAREAELVVFDKTTQGLGLKIIGGSSEDGENQDGVFIKRVLPGGLAELQGGLEEGDLILEVNGQSMEGITNERALSILRQASASNHVEIVITRDEEARNSFEELISRDKFKVKNNQENGDLVKPLNCEPENIPSHLAGYYQHTVGLHADLPHVDQLNGGDFLDQQSDRDGNSSRYSPASSCNSELSHHMRELASPTCDVGHGQGSSSQLGHRSMNGMSLNTVLSHSFPLAVDSVSPNCKFPVPKLEKTLETLGFVISTQKHIELLKHIPVDSQGLTTFAEFVSAVRHVLSDDLHALSNSQSSTPLLPTDSLPCSSPSQMNGFVEDPEIDNALVQENEFLQQQIETLKEELEEQKRLCQRAEEQVLSLRKESQTAMEESRSLRTKLRLAEQSQEAARKMEQDYEQVVAMLENEISHLRLQMAKLEGINEQRRLAVAACQLKKSEMGKKTYEVATNKLLAHLHHVHDILSETSHIRSREGGKAEKKKKQQKDLQSLVTEGQDIIRTVHTLIEQVPLPFGWEENYTADGTRYYINHLNQTTSWTHPSSNVEHQSIAIPIAASYPSQSTTVDAGKPSNNAAPLEV